MATPSHAHQPVNEGLQGVIDLIESAQGGYGALAWATGLIAKGFHELDVLAGARAGELDEQATTLTVFILFPAVEAIETG
jgi:hypothetical protein